MPRYATAIQTGQTSQLTPVEAVRVTDSVSDRPSVGWGDPLPAAGNLPAPGSIPQAVLPGTEYTPESIPRMEGRFDTLPDADSIPENIIFPMTDSEGFRLVSAAESFGVQSQSIPPPEWSREPNQTLSAMTDNFVFKAFVVLVFVGYCAVLHYHRDSLGALLKSLRSKLYSEKLIAEQNHTFSQFLRMILVIGTFACSVLIIRCAVMYADPELFGTIPPWIYLLIPVAVAGVFFVVGFYQRFLLRIVAAVIGEGVFFDQLILLRRIMAAVGIVFITPFILILALNDAPSARNISYLIVLMAGIVVIYFIFKTNRYFVGQKISFLYWILYLCAIEIFPLSVLIALAMRTI